MFIRARIELFAGTFVDFMHFCRMSQRFAGFWTRIELFAGTFVNFLYFCRMFQRFAGISWGNVGISWGNSWGFSWEIPGDFLGKFGDSLGNFPGNFLGNFWEISGKCLGNVWEFSRDVQCVFHYLLLGVSLHVARSREGPWDWEGAPGRRSPGARAISRGNRSQKKQPRLPQ